MNRDEVNFLLDKEYSIFRFKDLLTDKVKYFLLLPRHNESPIHHFLVYNIKEFLEKNGIEVKLYVTKKPDIVFQIGKKNYAIEVETGSAFSKIKNLKEKVESLNENYDSWFFVVTKRKLVKKYKQFGNSVDKRYVKLRLNKILKKGKMPKK